MSIAHKNTVSFPAFMNELMKPDWLGGAEVTQGKLPAVNIKEAETGYQLELAVPGRKKEDFSIEVDNEVLTISAEVKNEISSENEVHKVKFTRKEFSLSAFKRAFTLPETINTEKIEASYEDGILSFKLPKKEEALPKAKRMIELS